jgi:hypothetical protein
MTEAFLLAAVLRLLDPCARRVRGKHVASLRHISSLNTGSYTVPMHLIESYSQPKVLNPLGSRRANMAHALPTPSRCRCIASIRADDDKARAPTFATDGPTTPHASLSAHPGDPSSHAHPRALSISTRHAPRASYWRLRSPSCLCGDDACAIGKARGGLVGRRRESAASGRAGFVQEQRAQGRASRMEIE